MSKGKFIVSLLVILVLGLGVYGVFQVNNKSIENEEAAEEETPKEESNKEDKNEELEEDKEEAEENVEIDEDARKKSEEMDDDELLDLIHKWDESIKGNEEVTDEESAIIESMDSDRYYDVRGLTDEEVLEILDSYHYKIDSRIFDYYKDDMDDKYMSYLPGDTQLEWIRDNYDFEEEHQRESVDKILSLTDEYEDGNIKALFPLKYEYYELNKEINPESLEQTKAIKISLEDAERIEEGKEPKDLD